MLGVKLGKLNLPKNFHFGLLQFSQKRNLTFSKRNFSTFEKDPIEYHRQSTNYPNTTREVLDQLNKTVVPPPSVPSSSDSFSDKFAYYFVRFLRKTSNLFFRQKYVHYACVLETIAAVPGLAGGMANHLRCLRKLEHNNWIKTLLDESENERMHLMTFIALVKPSFIERLTVLAAQFIYWHFYLGLYFLFPKTAHRFVGYLEQEAIISYTNMLKDIDAKKVPNYPAPQIAIDYWGLPKDSTLRDVILVIRADEMDHRDVNHTLSDLLKQGKKPSDPFKLS